MCVSFVIEWIAQRRTKSGLAERLVDPGIDNNLNVSENPNLPIEELKLDKLELDRLKHCEVTRKQLLTIDFNTINCSICYDRFSDLRHKIISIPKCRHLFHWS
jgi:hypothetical protein